MVSGYTTIAQCTHSDFHLKTWASFALFPSFIVESSLAYATIKKILENFFLPMPLVPHTK